MTSPVDKAIKCIVHKRVLNSVAKNTPSPYSKIPNMAATKVIAQVSQNRHPENALLNSSFNIFHLPNLNWRLIYFTAIFYNPVSIGCEPDTFCYVFHFCFTPSSQHLIS